MKLAIYALAFVAAVPAYAGGYHSSAAPAPAPIVDQAPVAATDWSGFYGGVQLESIADGSFDFSTGTVANSVEGNLAGVFAGYRQDFGSIVVGAELDYLTGSGTVAFTGLGQASVDFDLTRFGGEVGYDLGDFLLYGSAGFARLSMDDNSTTNGDADGFYYGIGVDYRINQSFIVGAELLQHVLDANDLNTGAAASSVDLDLDVLTFGINVAFTF